MFESTECLLLDLADGDGGAGGDGCDSGDFGLLGVVGKSSVSTVSLLSHSAELVSKLAGLFGCCSAVIGLEALSGSGSVSDSNGMDCCGVLVVSLLMGGKSTWFLLMLIISAGFSSHTVYT